MFKIKTYRRSGREREKGIFAPIDVEENKHIYSLESCSAYHLQVLKPVGVSVDQPK